MTPWESFIARRKINTASFLAYSSIDTREKFLSHLREIGVAPPAEDVINSLFPIPKTVEVKVETAKAEQERTSEENTSATRSDFHKRNGSSRTSGGAVPPEDRSNKNS